MTEQIGRYLVRGEIGKGGFGVVYRGYDPVMRRDVAIKVLTAIDDPGMLARFRSEPSTTGLLKHKNIITVHDFGEHNSAPYLVMELLEGRSLRDAMDTAPALPLSEKVAILGEVARGLWHAHQSGVIHRDIKPANIMLLANGAVKILDFGIARLVSPDLTRQTSTGIMVGTPTYMSPEQFDGEEASALSDIFGYGVLSYELLSGVQPFRGPHLAALVKQITTKDPEPLRSIAPECSEALESLVRLAMAKRTSDRYQSFRDLLFDLAPIEAGFRKERTDAMAEEADRALETGDLNAAQEVVWRALELDPNHGPNQDLRRRIQRQRERLASEERWKAAVEEAEGLLRKNSFDEAIQTLERMRGSLGSDAVADLRADLETRVLAARYARETAQRIAALLAEAQDAAKRSDLAAASQGAAQVLSIDSGNTIALSLEAWVAAETERAQNAEAERQHREQVAKIRHEVRVHIADLCFYEASLLIDSALKQYPSDRELIGLQSLVDSARRAARRQAAEALRAEEDRQSQEPEPANQVKVPDAPVQEEATDAASQLERPVGPPPADPLAIVASKNVAETPDAISPGVVRQVTQSPKRSTTLELPLSSTARLMLAAVGVCVLIPVFSAISSRWSPSSRPNMTVPPVVTNTPRAGDTKVNPKDGLTYVWIPPGTFQMGCSPGDDACDSDEKPVHPVTITKSFWMGQSEVTQDAYQRVKGANPSHFRGSKLPVDGVTWTAAQDYCQAAGMRLPTEAEWEYAARAGSTESRYGDLDQIAWYGRNSGDKTHEGGGKKANSWGLQDVLGNLFEWVADWYSAPYPSEDATDPQGPVQPTYRVIRGGSWYHDPKFARVSARHNGSLFVYKSEVFGFRCAGN